MPSKWQWRRQMVSLSFILFFTAVIYISRESPETDLARADLHLYVNYWPPLQNLKQLQHAVEVQNAILLNIRIPHLDVVHVFLEASPEFTCRELVHFMEARGASFDAYRSRLACTESSKQPTYFDMFMLAKNHTPAGHVAIVLNADMVFDHTLSILRNLAPRTVGVIATAGFSSEMPKDLMSELKRLEPSLDISKTLTNRCYDVKETERTSWDAFIFRPTELVFSLEAFLDESTQTPFPMNQNGAENSALNGLLSNNKDILTTQLCDFVKMWHIHFAEKMHHQQSETFVNHATSAPEIGHCSSERTCLGH